MLNGFKDYMQQEQQIRSHRTLLASAFLAKKFAFLWLFNVKLYCFSFTHFLSIMVSCLVLLNFKRKSWVPLQRKKINYMYKTFLTNSFIQTSKQPFFSHVLIFYIRDNISKLELIIFQICIVVSSVCKEQFVLCIYDIAGGTIPIQSCGKRWLVLLLWVLFRLPFV